MRKRSIALAAAAAIALTMTGCSGSGTQSTSSPTSTSPRTISFMGWGSDEEIATFKTMIAQYETKYPDVKVDYITVAADDFATKLQTMIASGKTPDVFYLQPEKVMPYANAGVIADLSDFVAKNDLFDENNVWPKALDMYRYDGTTPGKGAIYGLPKDISAFAVAYNKDMFKEAGITAPTADHPWTWDEYAAAAKKLTHGAGANKVYGSGSYSLESAVWSNGADWLNEDHTKVTVTDPKFNQALQWVADLSLVDHAAPTAAEQSAQSDYDRFVSGKLGMMGTGSWAQGSLWADAKFGWDIMPWAVSPNTGKEAIWYGGIGLAVSSKSKYQTDASNLAAFIAFNKEAQQTNIEKGQAIPNLIDMAKNDWLNTGKPPANKAEFLRILEVYGRRATQTYTYNSDWFTLFNSNVAAVTSGEKTAEQYTASVQDEMQKLLDKGIEEQHK